VDDNRFDALARRLARTASRRQVVGAIVLGAAGAPRLGAAPAAAQAGSCAGKRAGAPCGQCGSCLPLYSADGRSEGIECVPLSHACRSGAPNNDACVHCDPNTFTCQGPRACGPCEKCLHAGCVYVEGGRDGQCIRGVSSCDPATGRCRCESDLACRACEHCREGECVPCDEACERCDGERGCVSTCESQCQACVNGECVEPDPPICVCGAEDEGGAPAGKRIYLPVVGAAGDTSRVEPCGEGDAAQCCAPEQCCGEGAEARCCGEGFRCLTWDGIQYGPICCPLERACGDGPNAECCAVDLPCLPYDNGLHVKCCPPVHVYGDWCLA
jgi:hypothetical protein